MSRRCSRRTALKMMAATAAGASLPWLRSPSARAQSNDVPLRILFIEAGPGCRRGTFEPTVPGSFYVSADRAESSWAFRDVMAPLAPYRDRATLFQGLDMLSARADPSSPANAHIDGATHMLTGDSRYQGSSGIGNGPSIDQFIAQQLAQQGAGTKLQSFEVMATNNASANATTAMGNAYSAPGQQVPFITFVPDAWQRLFSEPLANDDQAQALLANRRSLVHTFVRGEYDRLLTKVSPEDREKLSQMRDYRSDLFRSASVVNNRAANRPAESSIMQPWSQLTEGYQKGTLANPTWKVHAELMGKLAAAALHTDTTRVVNLSLEVPPDYQVGYVGGTFGASDLHDLDHKVSGDKPQINDAGGQAVIDKSHNLMYQQVGLVLDELARLKETDGKSLLDHTVVVIVSHIADGTHDLTRLPWIVFGDAHGYLKTGQYVRFAPMEIVNNRPIPPDNRDIPYQFVGESRAHNDLFVTLANAMGIGISTFGNAQVCKGPIAQMVA